MHYEWNHGLGEVVTALIEAGLTLDWVRVHRTIYWRALPWLVPAAHDGEWRLPDAAADLAPLMYSIRARRGTSPPNPLSSRAMERGTRTRNRPADPRGRTGRPVMRPAGMDPA